MPDSDEIVLSAESGCEPARPSWPMTPGQSAIWQEHRTDRSSPAFNIGGCCFLEGSPDPERLRQALSLMVAGSEALRLAPDGHDRLVLADPFDPPFDIVDLGAPQNPREAIQSWWTQRFRRPFDPDAKSPLWRMALIRAGAPFVGVMPMFHHVIMDGYGTSVFMQRWAAVYSALAAGTPPPAQETQPYTASLDESQAYIGSSRYQRDRAFWRAQLPTAPTPLYAPQATGGRTTGGLHRHGLALRSFEALDRMAAAHGGGVASCLLATMALYHARITHRPSVVIGVPVLNRDGRRHKSTLGMFTNIIPVPVIVPPSATLSGLVATVTRTLRTCYRHSRYPTAHVARDLETMRGGRLHPFDLVLSFERQDYSVTFGDVPLVEARQLFSGVPRFPMALTVCAFNKGQDIELVLETDDRCVSEAEGKTVLRRLIGLLQDMIERPDSRCDAPNLDLGAAATETGGQALCGPSASVIAAIRSHMKTAPQATALIDPTGSVPYGALDRWSQGIASRLRAQGAGRDTIIAVAIRRSPAMVAAFLGIMRAGAAFLPLDPDGPPDRLRAILAESGVRAILIDDTADPATIDHWSIQAHGALVLAVGSAAGDTTGRTEEPDPAGGALAYVLYTSGTSGAPKGVMVEHGALTSRLGWIIAAFGLTAHDRACQGTQATFDPALIELLAPLCQGGAVILPPPGCRSVREAARMGLEHGATFAAFVPGTLAAYLDAIEGDPRSVLRVACCGGESLPPALAHRFLTVTGGRLFHVYGPTEATIFATAWTCRPTADQAHALPIGAPLTDTRVRILDDAGQPAPFGVDGEIHIGGAGLARGYLGRPNEDARRFVPDPDSPDQRLYRTGDRGLMTPDGLLQFRGRLDRQIKIRGYRIEPEEIEAVLASHPAITAAVVEPLAERGSTRLAAWVAAPAGEPPDLRRFLACNLPDYMMPSRIHCLEALPTGRHGKIDRKRLYTLPDEARTPDIVAPPRPGLEDSLALMWEGILGRRPAGRHDNFFESGGDSLSAVTFLSALEDHIGRSATLSLAAFIGQPTLAGVATLISARMPNRPMAVPLAPTCTTDRTAGHTASQATLFLAASGHGDALRFRALAEALGNRCSLVMLQPWPDAAGPGGSPSVADLARDYADLIEVHADSHGAAAVHLGGFSVGGVVALETARLLTHRGRPPARTFLLDTIYPFRLLFAMPLWRAILMLSKAFGGDRGLARRRLVEAALNDQALVGQARAMRGYRLAPFAGPVDLLVSSGLAWLSPILHRPWSIRMGKGVVARLAVPGLHEHMFDPPHVEDLARTIAQRLDGRGQPAPPPGHP